MSSPDAASPDASSRDAPSRDASSADASSRGASSPDASSAPAAGRNLRLWIVGAGVSLFGDAALWLAAGIWVKDLTGSNAQAGAAFLAFLAPRLLAPLTGYVADRFRRRRLIGTLNLALAGWTCLAFAVRGPQDVWLLYVVLVGVGLGAGLHNAAGSALLTRLVPADGLGRANALLRTVQEVGLLAAPALGTALYVAVGPGAVATVEVATFVVCAGCVWAVRVAEPPPAPRDGRLVRELLAGVAHLSRTSVLRDLVLAMGGALLAFGLIESVIFAVADQGLHRPASFVGVLTFVKSAGSVCGGLLALRLVRRLPAGGEALLTAAGLALLAVGAGVLILPGLVPAVAGVAVIGLGIPLAVIGLYTVVQRNSPAQLQGRVAAAAATLVTAPQVVSVATGVALISSVDYRLLLGIILAVIAAGAGYLAVRTQARLTGASLAVPADLLPGGN